MNYLKALIISVALLGAPFTAQSQSFPDGIRGSASANAGGSSYLVYTALLSQDGTPSVAPVANVRQNTLGGAVTFGYVEAGSYTATLPNPATDAQHIWVIISADASGDPRFYNASANAADTIAIKTWEPGSMTKVDGMMSPCYIEIRVYP